MMIQTLHKIFGLSKFSQRYLFCNTKFLEGLKKQRSRLLLESATESFKGYQKMREKSRTKFGDDSQNILMRQGITPPVPGLIYIPNFVTDLELKELQQKSLALYQQLCRKQEEKTYTNKSYNHNLAADKHYKLLSLTDDSSGQRPRLDAQMFKNYGSGQHDLTYFIDNKNIPQFVKQILVRNLEKLRMVQQLRRQEDELNWRLTFNIYKENKQEQTGFLWHKDIAVNGIVTSITTVMGEAYFQIKTDDPQEHISYKVKLTPKSLVVLSGESRWRWVHRVIRKHDDSVSPGTVSRISLVLGCR